MLYEKANVHNRDALYLLHFPVLREGTRTSLNVDYLGTCTINWSATNATTCSSDGGSGKEITGSFTTPPLTKTTTFTLIATGPGGTATGTITITVGLPPKPTLKVTLDKGFESWR
jgi:hypothetical protein